MTSVISEHLRSNVLKKVKEFDWEKITRKLKYIQNELL